MAEKYVRRSRQYIREEGESKKKKEEKHWERAKDEYEKKRERERRVVTQLYRLRLFCLRRLVSCRISVFGVASSGPSNPADIHYPVPGRICLWRVGKSQWNWRRKRKKMESLISSLASFCLALSFSFCLPFLLILEGCILQTDCTFEPKCVSHRSFFSFSRRKRHYALRFKSSCTMTFQIEHRKNTMIKIEFII